MDIYEHLKRRTDYSLGYSNKRCELIYEDTSFDNIVFTNYDLNHCSFLGVSFTNCDFSQVYLSAASLCGSTFQNCILIDNIFRKGNADHATFKSNIDGIDTFRTSFYECNFDGITIKNSKMNNSFFAVAIFTDVIFINVDFSGSSFSEAKFKNVKFIDCHFSENNFDDVEGIDSVDFQNVSVMDNGKIKKHLNNEFKILMGL